MKNAIESEFHALLLNGTWDLMTFHVTKYTIGCKWVFCIKLKINQTLDIYKTHLVAKGFLQTIVIDFFETFSPAVIPMRKI